MVDSDGGNGSYFLRSFRVLFFPLSSVGPIYGLNLAGQNAIVLNTHKVAFEVLDKRSAIYSDRPRMIVIDEILCRGYSLLLFVMATGMFVHSSATSAILEVYILLLQGGDASASSLVKAQLRRLVKRITHSKLVKPSYSQMPCSRMRRIGRVMSIGAIATFSSRAPHIRVLTFLVIH